MADDGELPQLVMIGAPAAGFDALSQLVATLPADFPAPIVIVQHHDPKRASHLAEILGKRTSLPVRTILDHGQLIPGKLFVIPSGRHVEIRDGHLSLSSETNGHPQPSIDLFFSTAAQIYGDRLLGVILSGLGSAGAASALAVKKAGGTVIIQNPATAQHSALSRTLSPATVDFEANIEEIGLLLNELVRGALQLGQANEAKTLQSFLHQLHERSGLDFTNYKRSTIQRRLKRRMVATRATTVSAYMRYLQQHSEEYARLISSFQIKVTEFFRDTEFYTALRAQILPDIINAARQHGNELRLWLVGCGTGEEAYSLAILIAEILGDEIDRFTVRIFATDLDNDAISFARRGSYPAPLLAAVPPELVRRYFQQVDGEYEVQKRIRNLMIFGLHDLGHRAPFPRIDFVLCRNALSNFGVELQKRVLQLFAYALRDGGYLALDTADTTSPAAESFAPALPTLKVYRRAGERLLIPLGQHKDPTLAQPSTVLPGRAATIDLHVFAAREQPRQHTSLEKLGALVFNLPIGVVVVDRHYDVQIINSRAHSLLGIHRPAMGEDLVHLAESELTIPLRAIIDAALRGAESLATGQVVTVAGETGAQRYVQIVGYQQKYESAHGPMMSVLLLMTDVTAPVMAQRQLAAEQQNALSPGAPTAQQSAQIINQQQQELQALAEQVQRSKTFNRELHEANQELASVNVDLHRANEEFQVNTEEVQAAAEEVETLNEELQATNEELETLNEELQATVEELNATNDDLEARTVELQELARTSEARWRASDAERAQLAAILESMNEAVLVVDKSGQPVRSNSAYVALFGDPAHPLAVADAQGRPLAKEATPLRRAARGETFDLIFTLPGPDRARHFEASGRPLQAQNDGMAILVIRDITARVASTQL